MSEVGEGLKFDGEKVRMDLLPLEALEGISKVLTFGAQKYEANSWQSIPNGYERYRGALLRHMVAIDKGEQVDEESGLPHVYHLSCCALFMAYLNQQEVIK